MTIRWRLTLWYGGIFTLILLGVLGFNYAFFVEEQYRSVDRQMRQSVLQVEETWTPPALLADRGSELFMVLRWYGPDGQLRQTSHPWLALPPLPPRQVLQEPNRAPYDRLVEFFARLRRPEYQPPRSVFTLLQTPEERWRVYVRELRSGPQVQGYLEALVPLGRIDERVRRLGWVLLLVTLGAVTLIFAVGMLIARRALHPLERLTGTVSDIARSRDLSRRVEAPPTRDELSRLAQTFNTMLGALQEDRARLEQAEEALLGANTDLEQRVRERTAELEAARERAELLAALADALAGLSDPQAVAWATLERLGPALGVSWGAICRSEGERLYSPVVWGKPPPRLTQRFAQPWLPLDSAPLVARALQSGQGVYLEDYSDPPYPPGTRLAVATEPLLAAGRPYGALQVARQAALGPWRPGERDLLTRAAQTLGLALERAELTQRLQAGMNQAVQAAGVGLWEWDLETGQVQWGGQSAKLYGFPPETTTANIAELEGLVPAEDLARVREAVRQAVAEQRPYEVEYRLRRKDGGEPRWMLVRGSPILEGSRVRRLSGTLLDITERKRAEEELRASEARLALAFEAAGMGWWEWNVQSDIHRWSVEFERLLGLEPGGFRGGPEAFLERVHPDDRERVARLIQGTAEQGLPRPREFEYRVVLPGGQVRWIVSRARVYYDPQGRPERLVGVDLDITERKRTEDALREEQERLSLALESGRMGAWDWDLQSDLERWSPEQERLFGFEPGQGIYSGAVFFQRVHPEDRQRIQAKAEEAAQQNQDYVEDEFRIVRPDGSVIWVSSRARLHRDEEGKVVRMTGVNMDVTERKRAEDALRQSEARLKALVEAQKRFVADASHELRAPLTAIQGNLEILTRFKNMKPKDREEAMTEAVREAQRLSRLVNDMLALARGDAGVEVRHQPLNLSQLLREAFEEARHLSQTHRLELGFLDEVRLVGDRDRLKQLAIILLDNALKYTPEGGTVRLELRQLELHQGRVAEFRVSDTGIGIAPEDLPRVFERFYRADQSRRRDPGGTGLGLSIARWIVEQHGGEIWLESELGQGTTVVVRLPLPVHMPQPPEALSKAE